MTLTTAPSHRFLSDQMTSRGITRSPDFWTTETGYEDPRSIEFLSSDIVFWTARIDVRARGGTFIVQGSGKEPLWLRSVLESLAELLSLDRGWDSYDASQISPDAAFGAVRILLELTGTMEFEIPAIVPTSRGGIQLEWRRPSGLIEVDVSPGTQPMVFIEDTQREEEFEVSLARSLQPLRDALAVS